MTKKFSKITKITVFILMFTMVLVSISSATACNLADSQWPKDGHDNQNTGQSQYLGPQNNTTKWTKNLTEEIDTNPIIGPDGTVYLGTYDDTIERGQLYAFNPDSTVKWNYTITDGEWSEISSTPAISSEGTIFLATNFDNGELTQSHGNLYALSDNGSFLWNYTVPGISEIYSSPAIGSDGTVYFMANVFNGFLSESNLYALTKDGVLKWFYNLGQDENCQINSPAIGPDGTIYVGINSEDDASIYALTDAVDHAIKKWEYYVTPIESDESEIIGSPSIGSDGTIYFGTNICSHQMNVPMGVFFALTDNTTNAVLKWYYRTRGEASLITSSPAITSDGNIYFGYAHDGSSLEDMSFAFEAIKDNVTEAIEQWSYDTEFVETNTPAIGSDGTIYFGDNLYRTLGLNPNGTVKWSLETGAVTASAISKVGTLYFGSYYRPDDTSGPVLYAIQGPPSSLYIKTLVDNTNPNIGDIITINYKVGNNGPNTAYSTVLKFTIPAGMTFVKAWTNYGVGSITYDATTNTVIWDLGDLPICDPDAWVQLMANAAGLINIAPSISTLTYDPNLSNNIQSVTVNVHAATTNAATATTKTVGMQSTGIPIAMFISAILMVLGGLVIPRRKK